MRANGVELLSSRGSDYFRMGETLSVRFPEAAGAKSWRRARAWRRLRARKNENRLRSKKQRLRRDMELGKKCRGRKSDGEIRHANTRIREYPSLAACPPSRGKRLRAADAFQRVR